MPEETFRMYRGRLPHWRAAGEAQHVVWRLARGQPALVAAERQLVDDALRHFDGDRYLLVAAAVMDDHVHGLVIPGATTLERVVHSWKSFTAQRLAAGGRRAPVWQREYYDHLVRDGAELEATIAYILHNPAARWPDAGRYPWVQASDVIV